MTTPAPPQAPSEQQLVQYAASLIAQRYKRDDVIRSLMQYGMSAPQAMATYQQAERQPRQAMPPQQQQRYQAQQQHYGRELNSRAVYGLVIGGIFLVGGIIATVAGYANAASHPNGGTYTIYYGAIIIGLIRVIWSLCTLYE